MSSKRTAVMLMTVRHSNLCYANVYVVIQTYSCIFKYNIKKYEK